MSIPFPACTVSAFAKLNLFLEVHERRLDGYHDIRSLAVPVSLSDQMRFRLSAGGGIRVRMRCAGVPGAQALDGSENLAGRAARRVLETRGLSAGLRVAIRKAIPIGGGLGGGSADAAATLVALAKLLGPAPDGAADMQTLAAELGSDVPAMLQGGAIVMEGRGERLAPLLRAGEAPEGFWLVLVNPGLHVSTAEIYQRCKRLTPPPEYYKNMVCSIRSGDVRMAAKALFNGLQPAVFEQYPEIQRLHVGLERAGALGAMVCGSGASLFALAESREHARSIQARLPANRWSTIAKTLPDGVMVAHGPLEP